MLFVGSPLQGSSLSNEQKIDLLIPQDVKDALKTPSVQSSLAYQWQKNIASGVIFKPKEEEYEGFE
jgi:hypothetical protein